MFQGLSNPIVELLLTPLLFSCCRMYIILGGMSGYLLAISLLSHLKDVPESFQGDGSALWSRIGGARHM